MFLQKINLEDRFKFALMEYYYIGMVKWLRVGWIEVWQKKEHAPGQKFQPVSGTDDLAAKRIEKLNDSEKKSC